jgi:hypothetical protein
MFYKFDEYGWYIGSTDTREPRATDLVPPVMGATIEEGQPASNWSGSRWFEVPYVKPTPFVPSVPEPTPEPEPAVEKKITQLAFISRFTDAEAIALDLASIGATVEAASIRRYMQKINAATFIDLSRADTISGVNQLEAVGLIGPGRAEVILTAPITDLERAK